MIGPAAVAPEARTWTPARPADPLLKVPPSSKAKAWRRWLGLQGYTDPEAVELLVGGEGRPPLGAVMDARVSAVGTARRAVDPVEDMTDQELLEARAGAVLDFLGAYPPDHLDTVDRRPVAFLTARGLGDRLVDLGEKVPELEGATVHQDLVTGGRWWVRRFEIPEQAGMTVIAGYLYRLLDVGAVTARLAVVGKDLVAAHPEPFAWELLEGDTFIRWAPELARELPADAWLGNLAGPEAYRARQIRIPGTLGTLRLDLAATMAFRGPGKRDSSWTGGKLSELGAAVEASRRSPWAPVYQAAKSEPVILAAMASKIVELPDTRIRQALAAGGLTDQARAATYAALMGRRELILSQVRTLIAGSPLTP